jgi:non-ribosomal peptide synthetase component F
MDNTLHDTFEIFLENNGDQVGNQVALVHSNTSVTYDEVNRSANRLARAIVAAVKRHLDRLSRRRPSAMRRKSSLVDDQQHHAQHANHAVIGISMEPSHGLVTVLLAILKAGGAVLPIEGDYPAAVARHMIRAARPSIVIVDIR